METLMLQANTKLAGAMIQLLKHMESEYDSILPRRINGALQDALLGVVNMGKEGKHAAKPDDARRTTLLPDDAE